MVKALKIFRTLALAILILFAATAVYDANSSDQIHVYEYLPVSNDLRVRVENPLEAYPNQTVNVNTTVEASVDLTINHVAIELYTFNDSKFDEITYFEKGKPVPVSSGESLNKISNFTIHEQASNIVYGKLILEWTKEGTEGEVTIERKPTFVMIYLRNSELESLRSKVPELEAKIAELKENVTKLNGTLTDALNNLTDLENRSEGGLSDTRSVVTILAITTIFFAATTIYLFTRKPKEYW
jgi:hypothetical protein